MDERYPEYLARGITRSECLDGDTLKRCIFQFSKEEGDRWAMSIQWLDNPESETIAKAMLRRDGSGPKYGLGFAVISTRALEDIRSQGVYRGLEYHRVPNLSEGHYNPYHGHITISSQTSALTRQLAAELVMRSRMYRYDDPLPVGGVSGIA